MITKPRTPKMRYENPILNKITQPKNNQTNVKGNHLHPIAICAKERWYKKDFECHKYEIPDMFASSMKNPRKETSQWRKFY